MNKDVLYTGGFFAVLVAYLFGGLFVQLVGGVEKWSDAPTYVALVAGLSLVVSVPVFFVIRYVRRQNGNDGRFEDVSSVHRMFWPVIGIIAALAASGGAWVSYGKVEEKMARDDAAKRAAVARERSQDAERQRLAAMTPEQRAAEEARKRKE